MWTEKLKVSIGKKRMEYPNLEVSIRKMKNEYNIYIYDGTQQSNVIGVVFRFGEERGMGGVGGTIVANDPAKVTMMKNSV
jgi:hypothetical protein